jgi:transcriptional regulator with XRE-family HTH domain
MNMSKVQAKNAKIKSNLAIQVRRYRKEARMTQEALAEQCGIFRTYLSRIEGGSANPTLSVMVTLASTLNVDLQKLLVE